MGAHAWGPQRLMVPVNEVWGWGRQGGHAARESPIRPANGSRVAHPELRAGGAHDLHSASEGAVDVHGALGLRGESQVGPRVDALRDGADGGVVHAARGEQAPAQHSAERLGGGWTLGTGYVRRCRGL